MTTAAKQAREGNPRLLIALLDYIRPREMQVTVVAGRIREIER